MRTIRMLFVVSGMALASGFAVAGTTTGFVLGWVANSLTTAAVASSTSGSREILYVMPRADERVKDPAEVSASTTPCITQAEGEKTFREMLWDITVNRGRKSAQAPTAEEGRREILRVDRVHEADRAGCFYVWFLYTRPGNVVPLSALPKEK